MTGGARPIALGTVAAVLCWLAYGQVWVVQTTRVPGLPTVTADVVGRDADPSGALLPFVALAALLAAWGSRGALRRLLAAVVAVAGIVLTVDVVRIAGSTPTVTATQTAVAAWAWIAGGAAVVIAASGVLVVLDRRATSAPPGPPASPDPSADESAAPALMWDALDAGRDPTDHEAPGR